jgi:hypothetical protein
MRVVVISEKTLDEKVKEMLANLDGSVTFHTHDDVGKHGVVSFRRVKEEVYLLINELLGETL